MRWLLLFLLLFVVPAGAESAAKPYWASKPKQGWVHQLGVCLKVPLKATVTCENDALHIETDEFLVQIFCYATEAEAMSVQESTLKASERTFSGLKFGAVKEYDRDGARAYLQEGTADSIGFLLVRLKKHDSNVLVFSVMKTAEAQKATLSIMSALKYPK